MDLFSERRFGTFSFDAHHLRHHAQGIQALLTGCIVIRCEHLFDSDAFEYTALHPAFAPVKIGERAHRYGVLFTAHKDGHLTYEFKQREP